MLAFDDMPYYFDVLAKCGETPLAMCRFNDFAWVLEKQSSGVRRSVSSQSNNVYITVHNEYSRVALLFAYNYYAYI